MALADRLSSWLPCAIHGQSEGTTFQVGAGGSGGQDSEGETIAINISSTHGTEGTLAIISSTSLIADEVTSSERGSVQPVATQQLSARVKVQTSRS